MERRRRPRPASRPPLPRPHPARPGQEGRALLGAPAILLPALLLLLAAGGGSGRTAGAAFVVPPPPERGRVGSVASLPVRGPGLGPPPLAASVANEGGRRPLDPSASSSSGTPRGLTVTPDHVLRADFSPLGGGRKEGEESAAGGGAGGLGLHSALRLLVRSVEAVASEARSHGGTAFLPGPSCTGAPVSTRTGPREGPGTGPGPGPGPGGAARSGSRSGTRCGCCPPSS